MDYKEKIIALLSNRELSKEQKEKLEHIFPELKESEDEKIRKAIISGMSTLKNNQKKKTFADIPIDDCIAWLEKQGEKSVEPKWYHHKADLSDCSEEYRKAYYDGWNNCNMQHSQYISERNDVVKCLINGMKFYYEDNKEAMWGTEKFSMKVKDILNWLEKQDEQKPADKVEPKFKVKDWIANGGANPCYVKSIFGDYYELCSCEGYEYTKPIIDVNYTYHLWTIADAKDGDVLVASDGSIFLFAGVDDYACKYYAALTTDNKINKNEAKSGYWETSRAAYPATKKQRDLLFRKMKEADYVFDSEKKELKKFEHKFNVDDWIVTEDSFGKIVRHVEEIRCSSDDPALFNMIDKGYVVSDENGLFYDISFDNEHKWRKWSIKDADDGDVLVCNINKGEIGGDTEKLPNITPTIFIYKNVVKDKEYIHSNCSLYDGSYLVPQKTMYYNTFVHNIQPATKEQRELLFQKITEAGCKWDSEKKELSKQTLKTTMTQEEKELLLQDLQWIDMEVNECHCYNCELFDRKNNVCKCIDLCKNPKRTYKGFYIK